jgi:sigma-E factor negative regulatory protein RseA
MSEKDEKLSALIDNALDRKELDAYLGDLKRDPLADAERLQRYRMIGDVLRDEMSEASLMDISAAVHRAVDQETTPEVVPVSARLFNFPALVKPLTGMAIAASVAMVTVVAVRTVSTDSPDTVRAVASAQKPAANEQLARVTPVNPVIAQHVRAASTDAGQSRQLRNRQLSEYMMNHSGYAGQTTVQGMMPYARVVGFEAETRR